MVSAVTLWLFIGSQALYIGLGVISILRRTSWEQLAYVPLVMLAFIAFLFVRGSMTGRSSAGSMHIATFAALAAVVCTLGDPTRLMKFEDKDESKEGSSGFMAAIRRANRYQVAFLVVGAIGALGASSEYFE